MITNLIFFLFKQRKLMCIRCLCFLLTLGFVCIHGLLQAENNESVYSRNLEIKAIESVSADSALQLYKQLLKYEAINDSILCHINFGIANCYKNLHSADSAEMYFKKAATYFNNETPARFKSEIYHKYGNLQYGIGDYKKALQLFSNAFNIRKENSLLIEQAKSASNIGLAHFRLGNIDSALWYHKKALEIKHSFHDSNGIANSLTSIGNIYLFQTDLATANAYYLDAKTYIDTLSPSLKLATLNNNIGNIYSRQAKSAEALNQYFKALDIFEMLGNEHGMAKSYNNIALINLELDNIDEAMRYHTMALNLFVEIEDNAGIAETYFYMGRLYHRLKLLEKASGFYSNALAIQTQMGHKLAEADCLHNLGVISLDRNETDSAIWYLNKAIVIFNEISNGYALAMAYNNLAKANIKKKRYQNAQNNAKKALDLATMYSGLNEQLDAYNNLVVCFEKQGKTSAANDIYKQIIALKDSIYNIEKTELVLNIENKYQNERRQKEFDVQNALLKQRNNEIEYRNKQFKIQKRLQYTLILFLVIVSGFMVFAVRNLNQKKVANKKLIKQRHYIVLKNQELAELNTELENQQHQIEKQNEVLVQQNAKIEEINGHWQQSINYAQYIQQAVLPSHKKMQHVLNNHTLLYLPKDIVSGDFYWLAQHNSKTIVALGDCTGHGVPGGFLSMLGIAFLREIVTMQHSYEPQQILNNLRAEFTDTLKQSNSMLEYNDGMDISIVVMDSDEGTLKFAGANSKSVAVREGEIIELAGDKMSVGLSPRQKPFTQQSLILNENDTVYMFTDGIIDQYNDKGVKFGRNRFYKLIKESTHMPLKAQKEVIYSNLNLWKNQFEQIDDITVLAFKTKKS